MGSKEVNKLVQLFTSRFAIKPLYNFPKIGGPITTFTLKSLVIPNNKF